MSMDIKFGFHCVSTISSYERDPFLKNLVIGEKTWIIKMCIENTFDLKTIELQLSRFHPKKVLLSM